MFNLTSNDNLRDYTQYVDPEAFPDASEKLKNWGRTKADSTLWNKFARNAVLVYELVKQQIDYEKTGRTVASPRTIYRRQYGDCEDMSVLLASLAGAADAINHIRFTYVKDHVLVQIGTLTPDGEPSDGVVKQIYKAYREYFDREIGDLYWEYDTNRRGHTRAWLVADPTNDRGYLGSIGGLQTSGDVHRGMDGWKWRTLKGYRELPSRLAEYHRRT